MSDPRSSPSRVALVTGSVRGLGLGVARALAARGERVHVTWRSDGPAARSLEQEFPGRAHHVELGSEAAAQELVGRILEQDGRLDHVIHAVGEYSSGSLEELDGETLRRLFVSNVETSMQLASAARSALRASSGRLVFFGCAGLSAPRAWRLTAAYAAVKSCLLVLARSMALEEAPHGVTVNVLSPGVVPHPDAHPDTLDPKRQAAVPAGRATSVEEVAAAVLWLCTPEAAHTTGADLPVAGGVAL